MTLRIWFQDFFRPKVTSINVILYEKRQEVDIGKYSEQYLAALIKAVNGLCSVEKNSAFWFETEIYEIRKCFEKPKTVMVVTCYQHDATSNGFKRKMAIPIRYRKKLFDKVHVVAPEPVGVKTWPPLEVKFVLPK